jgi:hypothetical protein
MSAGRGPADPSAKNIWCDAKDHARPRKYLEQNIFSKRGVQVELDGLPLEAESAPDRTWERRSRNSASNVAAPARVDEEGNARTLKLGGEIKA